jgi:predicted RNA-binding protein with PIN domain
VEEEDESLVEIDFTAVKPPAIFVDGYNIIGRMRQLEGHSGTFHFRTSNVTHHTSHLSYLPI